MLFRSFCPEILGATQLEFVSIDVETANADMASICQIGVARFVGGALAEEWKTYVDPEDYFDGINVSIHGIDEVVVRGAPTFPKAAAKLNQLLGGHVVVSHTHFDRVALHQAASRHNTVPPSCTWLTRPEWREELGASSRLADMACRTSAWHSGTSSTIMMLWRMQKRRATSYSRRWQIVAWTLRNGSIEFGSRSVQVAGHKSGARESRKGRYSEKSWCSLVRWKFRDVRPQTWPPSSDAKLRQT